MTNDFFLLLNRKEIDSEKIKYNSNRIEYEQYVCEQSGGSHPSGKECYL